ncbi:hypothetical protein JOF56_008872 [Kibdelosporangium banguiense]|uniref:Uncharacterized protein n=1 Tax=Kibdelosporangium banguiense TaxID=1365924 RepID=A0ABS4TVS3_9PSEU|nr:hypothetical protein [Kibdelosporangium banguiense]MBP2328487.1 hypothetical protein [Kibdelosporangium banguiense]
MTEQSAREQLVAGAADMIRLSRSKTRAYQQTELAQDLVEGSAGSWPGTAEGGCLPARGRRRMRVGRRCVGVVGQAGRCQNGPLVSALCKELPVCE